MELLIEQFCGMGGRDGCLTLNDLLGLGIEGSDVMVLVGHWTADNSIVLPDEFWEQQCVVGGLLEVINGVITGADVQYCIGGECRGQPPKVVSFLGGTYNSSMAAEAGLPIDPRFIEDAWVTVKQMPVPPDPTDADLVITKEADTSEAAVGDTVVFTISVENLGEVDATGVVVMDVLPAGVNYVSSVPEEGTWYDVTSGVWNIGDVHDGETLILNITVTVNTLGEICNVARIIHSDQPDPDTGDNQDSACVTGEEAEIECVTLIDGWNLVSLTLIPDDGDIETSVLFDVYADVIMVAAYEGGPQPPAEWLYYNPDAPSDFATMADGIGYFINMDLEGPDEFCFLGYEISKPPPPPSVPPYYDLVVGYNLIGFKSTTPKLPQDYLAAIEGDYTVIYGFANGVYFIVGSPGNEYLQPGLGYWVAMTVVGTIYP
jgi:uncharacterized repeat protein (TIGR01451 family)